MLDVFHEFFRTAFNRPHTYLNMTQLSTKKIAAVGLPGNSRSNLRSKNGTPPWSHVPLLTILGRVHCNMVSDIVTYVSFITIVIHWRLVQERSLLAMTNIHQTTHSEQRSTQTYTDTQNNTTCNEPHTHPCTSTPHLIHKHCWHL